MGTKYWYCLMKAMVQRNLLSGLASLTAILLVTNTITVLQYPHSAPTEPVFTYTGIEAHGETSQLYQPYTDFSHRNSSITNRAWAQLNPDEGWVGLTRQWAADHQLPIAGAHPGDANKGVYILDAYHQLHCLMAIRNHTSALLEGYNSEYTFRHINHCFDVLRQAIVCRADDTPFYTLGSVVTGAGQPRRCRNWDALASWAKSNTACYRKEIGVPILERFGNCTV